MANRSDRNSKLPRRLKRQLALTSTGDPHRDGEIRRIMMAAHAHAVSVDQRRTKFVATEDDSEEVVAQ
jgi:hypothetical protein